MDLSTGFQHLCCCSNAVVIIMMDAYRKSSCTTNTTLKIEIFAVPAWYIVTVALQLSTKFENAKLPNSVVIECTRTCGVVACIPNLNN